ncbi:MAG: bifunctional riboflavin kinase/FAD synthetase [Bacteroidota bacterium]|nr:bifunctional riboflavin kinase/FAD synthetase [Bacteroidota bacterium]
MQVHRDINNLPYFKNAAITIGTFDGVHSGHLQIIQQVKREALLNKGESVIITFDPHPRMVLNRKENQAPIRLLTTLLEKTELLAKQGIDHLVVVPFTLEFSNQSAREYISDFLVEKFHPKTIIIGYDHRFGNNREGDYHLLEKYQQEYHYEVKEIPEQVLNNITISSTKIRSALKEGDITTAKECLGYDYFFEGKVVDGNKLGRTIGYPTANLEIKNTNKLIPENGIYAVNLAIGKASVNEDSLFIPESFHQGMMSIGIRPTIADNRRTIEVNIFDFNKDIYGRIVRVYVKYFLRNEEKFDSLEELKKQISLDEIKTKKLLSENES